MLSWKISRGLNKTKKGVKKGLKSVMGQTSVRKGVKGIGERVKGAVAGLKKESELGPMMHAQVEAALARMREQDGRLDQELAKAHGFAVFPAVGRATAVLGVTYGKGEVFERGKVIGYVGIVQVTIGTAVGGQTFDQIILFDQKEALDTLKQNKMSFAANASLAMVRGGAMASKAPTGMRTFLYSEGGLMVEAAIGVQKLVFKPAALGRLKGIDLPKPEPKPEEQAARGAAKGEEQEGEKEHEPPEAEEEEPQAEEEEPQAEHDEQEEEPGEEEENEEEQEDEGEEEKEERAARGQEDEEPAQEEEDTEYEGDEDEEHRPEGR